MSIHIFGIRHHGPGCARSLRQALEQLEPEIVLVEGPPDAQSVLPLLTHETMKPPVALLIYTPADPKRAVYYPFTTFSPEWQALHYALQNGIPARFMDLPQAIQLAQEPKEQREEPPATDSVNIANTTKKAPAAAEAAEAGRGQAVAGETGRGQAVAPTMDEPGEPPDRGIEDPLDMLARAAGYSDHELWWEQQIEQRHDTTHLFEGILEMMTELRADRPPKDETETRREAYMRQTILAAQKEGFKRIAVICGAWHAPVLTDISSASAKADAALLHGLKKERVEATWIPWTNSRLAYRSGYGAGITSPGWYEHLWTVPDRVTIRWLTKAAHLLREEGLDTSSASVIEAVRLGESLAALRELPMPGMAELHEAIETVLCNGDPAPMRLIRHKLEIGDKLGEVPPETPAVPLQRDLEARQRRLRLKPSTEQVTLDLDLRNETDRARSQLLHQLRLLNIPWGQQQRVPGSKRSTFHELWQLQWQVEFVVSLIEANVWGNNIETAATNLVCHTADTTQDLPQLTELLDKTILAEIPVAIDHVLICVQRRAAVSADVRHLMDALPPLARVARYGNVRQTRAEQVLPVIDGLFERVLVGLPGACASLDDDAAQQMVESIDHVQESVSMLNREEQVTDWQHALRQLSDRESVHGLVRGRCCRLLLEQKVLDEEELQRLARLALSPVTEAPQAAAWVEGVLRGSGLQVLHQDSLWMALDGWLSELADDVFIALLPLLRRAFSGFQPPERRAMGEKVKHLRSLPQPMTRHGREMQGHIVLNQQRADSVLPGLAQILGVQLDGN